MRTGARPSALPRGAARAAEGYGGQLGTGTTTNQDASWTGTSAPTGCGGAVVAPDSTYTVCMTF